ncbi:MAG: hypothetical protein M1815_002533 [Lichina confinis]|nr:MAG: hypothetical protein M1815_002533 [Lichina confinis]
MDSELFELHIKAYVHSANMNRQTPRNEAAKPRTHYEMFPESLPRGAPPAGAFAIDLRQLRREFLRLQGAAHPDRHSGELRSRAEATSTYINEAYRTLQDPLLRAQYLLSLRGIDVADDETATVEDPELLMQVLETRETIEEAQAEEDLEPLRRENDARIAASLSVLEKAFEADDLPAAKSEAVKLRYWVNIRDSVQNWEKGKPVVLIH